jgi:hypothetical protein
MGKGGYAAKMTWEELVEYLKDKVDGLRDVEAYRINRRDWEQLIRAEETIWTCQLILERMGFPDY